MLVLKIYRGLSRRRSPNPVLTALDVDKHAARSTRSVS